MKYVPHLLYVVRKEKMYEKEIAELQKIIDESSRIVFLKQLYQEDGYEVGEIQRVYSKEVNNRIGNMVKNAQKEERKVLLNLEELLQMIIKNNITYSVDAKGGNQ